MRRGSSRRPQAPLALDGVAPVDPGGTRSASPFHEHLRLAAELHERGQLELAALRKENSLLAKQLAGAGRRTSRASLDSAVPEQPPQEPRGQDAGIDLRQDAAPAPEEASEESPADGECLPGAVAEPTDDPAAGIEQHSRQATATSLSVEGGEGPDEATFPLKDHWKNQMTTKRRMSRRVVAGRFDNASSLSLGGSNENGCFLQSFVTYPSSPGRLCWDVIGGLMILYDLFSIPLTAFDPPQTGFLDFMDWFTLVYWTCNMPMTLFVGYVHNGLMIMDIRKIALRYVKTWLLVDLIVVTPDWVLSLARLGSQGEGGGDEVKMLRLLRLARMIRLLRLMKLQRTLQVINDLIETEYVSICVHVVKMIAVLLVLNHYIGCLWYLIGSSHSGDDTWIVYHMFGDAGWGYQYLTAFHWAITQFTPSSMHVQPQNSLERLFAILVVVFALVVFSYVVGSITGSLSQLRSMQEETYKQFWSVRRYLKQNRVPMRLASRIERYLEHAWASQRQTINLKNSKLFSLLSEHLHLELQYEISLPYLRVYSLFSELSQVTEETARRIASKATQRKALAREDCLFFPAEEATHMYILVSGHMEYFKAATDAEGKRSVVSQDVCTAVDKSEDFIAEPVLWTKNWIHLGELTSTTETEVLMLDPMLFSDIIHQSPAALAMVVVYGRKFIGRLNKMDEELLSDIGICSVKRETAMPRWNRLLGTYD